jgi:hypothetical protein
MDTICINLNNGTSPHFARIYNWNVLFAKKKYFNNSLEKKYDKFYVQAYGIAYTV